MTVTIETILPAEQVPTLLVGGDGGTTASLSAESTPAICTRKRQLRNHRRLEHDQQPPPPQQQLPSSAKKKTVHFAESATIKFIQNVPLEWTLQERDAVWYSQDDLLRQKRLCRKLAETMNYYPDDELFDKFGIHSVERRRQSLLRIQKVTACVKLLSMKTTMTAYPTQDAGVDDVVDDDTSFSSSSASSSSASSSSSVSSTGDDRDDDEMKTIIAAYSVLSKASAKLARGDGSRIEEIVRSHDQRRSTKLSY